jgi:integrase/recombinase XerD
LPGAENIGLDPLAARRPHLEFYIRRRQKIRRFKALHRLSALLGEGGFYRTCVIDGIVEHSPAEHVRRPVVPAESPTLEFTHLQLEALLTAARQSPNLYDFALVAHADPRTTMPYDRARKNLDRHPNCILAAYTASGT